jgi:hypothetical protein
MIWNNNHGLFIWSIAVQGHSNGSYNPRIFKSSNLKIILFFLLSFLLTDCSISYKFNGASINYDIVKTITIRNFPNQAQLVYPELESIFMDKLRNRYIQQTRLKLVDNNGDLELAGEIIGFDIAPMAVQSDGYAAKTKLTINVRCRYSNRKNPSEDFEQTFSSFLEFDSNLMLIDVQYELSQQITTEISDMIFNATVANW